MQSCPLCPQCVHSSEELNAHIIKKKHSNHASFSITCNLCGGTWTKLKSYQRHVLRKHGNQQITSDNAIGIPNDDLIDNDFADQQVLAEERNTQEEFEQYMGSYILRLKANHCVTNAAIDDIVTGTEALLQQSAEMLKEKVFACLNQHEAFENLKESLSEVFNVPPAASLSSTWLRNSFFKLRFGLIEPICVELGVRYQVNAANKVVDEVPAKGYCIPFLASIKQLLEMPQVAAFVNQRPSFHDAFCRDFCDGEYVKQHEIGRNRQALGIVAYCDDIEVVCPIGVFTKKDKLCLFFWMLTNIPPNLRSRLCAIQLLAVAKSADVKKFGASKLLQDFTDGLHQLCNEYDFGNGRIHRGWLLAFLGDTLASNVVGGFKEGVGFAHRICRTCEATQDTSKALLRHQDCILRTDPEHRERCKQLALPLTSAARQFWSREYGINEKSVLLDVPGFNIVSCLLHDPMNLLFEGVTMYETKLLLQYVINDAKYFTLAYLNRQLTEALATLPPESRPIMLTRENLNSDDNKLKQTAHNMWILAHILPVLVGHKVPENDNNWKNFLRLVQIQQLVTSPIANSTTVTTLTVLIYRHNEQFQLIYNDRSYLPKLHYLVHLPEQLKQFGPLRNQWCMRMEAKHSFFKRKKYKNTKNLPYTVAMEHQTWMSSQQRENDGTLCMSYLMKHVQTKKGNTMLWNDVPNKEALPPTFNPLGENVLLTAEAMINGVRYRKGDFVLHTIGSADCFPHFIKILHLIKHGDNLLCVGNGWKVDYFDSHINSYYISPHEDEILTFSPHKSAIPWSIPAFPDADNNVRVSPISVPDVEIIV